MNVLVLTPYIPYPPTFGGSVRIFHLIRQLSQRHAVHLLTFREEVGSGDPQGIQPYCASVTVIPRVVARKRWQQARSLFSTRSFQWLSHASGAMQAAMDRVVRERQIDLILVEFSQMAGFRFPSGVPVVVDEHNVEFDLLDRMAAGERRPLRQLYNRIEAAKFRREELVACRAAALTLVTSERDGALLRQHAPGLRTAVITNGVDCDYFARSVGPGRPDTAVFVGATHYYPNEDGVLFFLREVHGRVRAARPDFRVTVVGGRPTPAILELRSDSVAITGGVPDVRPYMWDAAVFVVPLRMGGGTRFKVVEAMAAGVPVVSTRLGAEGIPAVDGRDLLLADEPESFARAVVRVLTDPALAAQLAANGLQFVRQQFDWPVIGGKLEAALAAVRTA
ncbi:MAG: glycosyltransferase [Kiritimatiellia bacterium]